MYAPEAATLALIAEPLKTQETFSNTHLQLQGTLHAHFQAQRSEHPAHAQPVVAPIKVNRNEPYSCGSGKMYKQ